MKSLWHTILLCAIMFFLAACSAAPTPPTTPATPQPSQPAPATPLPPTSAPTSGDAQPPFMAGLLDFAAQKYAASAQDIKVIQSQAVNWPDACLSAAQPGEVCAQTITPGYRVIVEIKGVTYELHTDNGSNVRLAPGTPVAEITPGTSEPSPAGEAARLWLMDTLKIDASTIKVVSVAPVDWPDGCLGVHKPAVACS
jgi:hypothetical protein